MRRFKIILFILLFGVSTNNIQAQITSPKLAKPKISKRVNPNLQFRISTPFDKIMNDINAGVCYEIAMVSLELDTRNTQHDSFNIESRHGKGFLVKVGNELKAIFPLKMGIKQTRYQQAVETTIRISKDRNNAKIDIRNSSYYHLIYDAKIIKKKNGYFITVEKNMSIKTVSFTFAIYRTPCLI
jgi:hypothetical protein